LVGNLDKQLEKIKLKYQNNVIVIRVLWRFIDGAFDFKVE